MESRIQVPVKKTGMHQESTIHRMGFRIQDCLVFLNMGRYYWTANDKLLFSFIYLPLIRSPHFRKNLKTFIKEFSVRRFLTFADCFFQSGDVSFRFHAPRESPESNATFVSQPLDKEVGTLK